jgi:hypothetical protein
MPGGAEKELAGTGEFGLPPLTAALPHKKRQSRFSSFGFQISALLLQEFRALNHSISTGKASARIIVSQSYLT